MDIKSLEKIKDMFIQEVTNGLRHIIDSVNQGELINGYNLNKAYKGYILIHDIEKESYIRLYSVSILDNSIHGNAYNSIVEYIMSNVSFTDLKEITNKLNNNDILFNEYEENNKHKLDKILQEVKKYTLI